MIQSGNCFDGAVDTGFGIDRDGRGQKWESSEGYGSNDRPLVRGRRETRAVGMVLASVKQMVLKE